MSCHETLELELNSSMPKMIAKNQFVRDEISDKMIGNWVFPFFTVMKHVHSLPAVVSEYLGGHQFRM